MVAALTTPLMPGAGPPPTRMAIRLTGGCSDIDLLIPDGFWGGVEPTRVTVRMRNGFSISRSANRPATAQRWPAAIATACGPACGRVAAASLQPLLARHRDRFGRPGPARRRHAVARRLHALVLRLPGIVPRP